MESVPLTLAHTHARNAMLETRKSNPVAASEEHDLAAGEFATASQHCLDAYALRTLKLLEEEHKRLATLLRSQHEHPASIPSSEPPTTSPAQSNARDHLDASGPSKSTPLASGPANDLLQQPPRLPGHNRQLQRDTSSIASNLASARGIPSYPRRASPVSPTLSAQPAGGQLTDSPSRAKTSEGRLRERAGKTSHAPRQPWSSPSISPTEITSRQIVPADTHELERKRGLVSGTDETFQRFYSTFEGLISKLSAPLAFAGLPLGTDASDPARQKSSAETKIDRNHAVSQRSSASAEPDINNLFSRAALRAVRDANGGMPSNGTESFYVVPTTGGTVSYAGILSRAEKEARRGSMDDGGDEDFVDARETPASPEMRQSLTGSRSRLARGGSDKGSKTLEELRMENDALRQLSDQLSKRLHMWEVNAQSSSMALQQSLKAMHHQQYNSSSPTASSAIPTPHPIISNNTPSTFDNHEKRIKELEDIIQRSEKEKNMVVRENEKLKSVLGRYRERWEKLKQGAKTRRNAAEYTAAAISSPDATPVLQQTEGNTSSADPNENTQMPNDEDVG
ncbi:hypothetical protein UA08_07088 [Talaromyces atroroseus]|uniref:Uncharacterized protein n=1 Tax=Talaromyces atroroseus TaxID=1441469 RepID=A0A225ART5_TALAT|nr:hypothetical protein UA08_07088 [Talaromyces atroroseus]OKL57676.1 hypothetical protein UA08_07088 [Talaromyces atroroseus]